MKVNLMKKLFATQPTVGGVRFIAIDGHGGSGKSTLAEMIAKKFNAEIIHTDDFAAWDNPLNWYPDVVKKIFKPIARGAKTLSYERSAWWENHHPESVINQPVTDVMILEGVSSARKEFRDYISLSIFVDAPNEICLKRGIERDLSTGKREEEIISMWETWFKEEEEYMQRNDPKGRADIVIDGTRPFDEQIDLGSVIDIHD